MNKKIPLHPTHTPHKAYARLMRLGVYAMAARVASQYALGRDLVIPALDRALCRFEELGHPELATALAEELGFTMVSVTQMQLPQMLRALEEIENVPSQEADPRTLN